SFRLALEALYSRHTGGHELRYTLFGKPEPATYVYAENLLETIAAAQGAALHCVDSIKPRRRVYAVGDNPASDVAGANAYGWTSLLVRTGVFDGSEGENSREYPADAVVENVEE
ncbi:HAD-hyrolase-like-domain-containing protein, partial [Jimgerdemannia flammicorona]